MKNIKRSFHFAWISSGLLLAFVILSQTSRTTANGINDVVGYLLTCFFVCVVLGFVFSMLSLKEQYHWKKYVSLGINSLYFILLVIALIANLQDLAVAFG